jgi:hypothetical protein
MERRTLILGFAAASFTTFSSAAEFWLVTEAEAERERAASAGRPDTPPESPAAAAAAPGAPTIMVEQPDQSRPIGSPVAIRIKFQAQTGARIQVSSFRVTYGSFVQFDITDRVKQHATLNENGISAQDVRLPAGSHTVTLAIGDDRGRVGTRTIKFTVA